VLDPAYIGPGPGLALQAPAFLLIGGALTALLALLTLPLRWLWRRPRKPGPARARRVVILGLDGLEPSLVEAGMQEGWLPSFARLARKGSYQTLATTCPPLSPVAWSTFATGVNPGKHGIFDFVHRTPGYSMKLAFSEVGEEAMTLGPLRLPWKRPYARQLRRGQSFWRILGEYGIFSHVLRVPVTFPEERFHGALLSAMGVPDLRGTQGTYTLFSPQPESLTEGYCVTWERTRDGWEALLTMPPGTLKLRLSGPAPWILSWGREKRPLELGKYSPWLRLPLGGTSGLARFVLLDDGPRLYMTPVQLDPLAPALPLASPSFFSVALARLLGDYATCGMAEDTGGREDGVLTQALYLEQCYSIHREREAQFFHLLRRTPRGLCAAVFDGTDRIQHMAMESPDQLRELYQEMDRLLGRVLTEIVDDDLLLVLSDHGFKPFRRQVDVNAWLRQNGYLEVAEDGSICWERTRVFALGLAGLHINLKGRHPHGQVDPSQLGELKARLRQELTQWVDPATGQRPIVEVFDSAEIYQGPFRERGPDLVVGYEVGYRISKSAARGEVGSEGLSDNTSPWCGDHCLHPARVPGILLSNHPLSEQAHLRDIAPTVLAALGVPPGQAMEGLSLWT